MIDVALVDDHALLRSALTAVINTFEGFHVVFEADNGRQLVEMLKTKPKPHIILLDVNMPEMDGVETSQWLKQNAPEIKILVLSMMEDDMYIIRMLRNGAKGYILKDAHPNILKTAMKDVMEKGFYLNEVVTGKLIHILNHPGKDDESASVIVLSDKEVEFLKYCCSEKSYKEIADAMSITPRAAEALRSQLFEKLETQSRVGLVLYALKKAIVKL